MITRTVRPALRQSALRLVPLLALLFAALLAAPGAAQRRAPDDEAARLERWHRMSPEQRDLMRRRLLELRQLSDDERRALETSVENLRALRRSVEERARAAEPRDLESLSPDERRDALRRRFLEQARERGGRIREMLPPDFRERLQQSRPAQRARMLGELREELDQRRGPRALERLGGARGLPPEEIERFGTLDRDERREALLRLRREDLLDRAQRRGGPPAGLSPEDWERIAPLPPRPFLEELHRARGRRGLPPEGFRGRLQEGDREGGPEPEGPGGGPPPRHPRRSRDV